MPELPDVEVYLQSLDRMLSGQVVRKAILKSPFLLRTFEPPLESINNQTVRSFSRIGKRIVWHFDETSIVIHLMIAGRFHWRKPERMPTGKNDLLAFWFDQGTMMLTEASTKKRASLHVLRDKDDLTQFDRGGIEPLEVSLEQFAVRIVMENRTLKRALTDPRIFSGIGNAYSDEILLVSRLSPLKWTSRLNEEETTRLYEATRSVLSQWIQRLSEKNGDRFPERVTAFRPEMLAHGKFEQPCLQCNETVIQRIRYSANECNYCPRCQTVARFWRIEVCLDC